jgi:hypothetical protein
LSALADASYETIANDFPHATILTGQRGKQTISPVWSKSGNLGEPGEKLRENLGNLEEPGRGNLQRNPERNLERNLDTHLSWGEGKPWKKTWKTQASIFLGIFC